MNNRSNAHVLLVDDNEDFAREYAETLQNQCGATVIYAASSDNAIKMFKNNSIKVVILDQKMDPIKGTEMFKILKKIDPKVGTILLTTEAERRDLTEATNIGFDYALLKEEPDIESLPIKILLLIMRYNSYALIGNEPLFYKHKSGGLLRRNDIVEYFIMGYETLDESYVFPDSWITRNFIEKGTTLTLEEELNIEKEFNFKDSFKIISENNLGFSIDETIKFTSNLALKMEHDFESTYTESLKKVMKRKVQLDIDSSITNILSRVYEYTKVFRMVKVFLKKICSCCQGSSIDAITAFLPVPIVRYRIREYYDDGTNKERESGEIRG
ncbi:MAG: response regulator [Oscillospiraceae bacterium]|nr:response regulator [Oscillospiraceae bacterium]